MRSPFKYFLLLTLLTGCNLPESDPSSQPLPDASATGDLQPAVTSEGSGEHPSPTPQVDAPFQEPITRENLDQVAILWQFEVGSDSILDLAFSPDSSLLAVAADDNHVNVYRAADGELVHALDGHAGRVHSVAFSPDGSLLASGGVDHSIILWQVSDGAMIAKLNAHDSYVNALDFSPDGSLLASGGEDRDVIMWQLSDRTVLHRFDDAKLSVGDVEFSHDGRFVASAGGEATVYVWDVASGELHHTCTGNSTVSSIAYAPDGGMLVGGSWSWYSLDNELSGPIAGLAFWDVETGEKLDIHTLVTIALDMSFFPDSSILVAGNADDHALNFWDAATGELLHQLYGPAWRNWSIVVSPDGAYIGSGGDQGELVLWGLPLE